MRKLLLAAFALFMCVGLTLAAEVVFVKFDKEKHELTVKEDGGEKTYKLSKDAKFMRGDMDVPHEKGMEALEKANSNEKAKGKMKLEVKIEKDEITEVKMKGGKKKN
jgi:hypothetical protein